MECIVENISKLLPTMSNAETRVYVIHYFPIVQFF